jgi:ubiquinone biosynthesis protein UbiJ
MARWITNLINYLLGFDPKTTYYASALVDCSLEITLKLSEENHEIPDKHYFITFNAQGLRAIESEEPLDPRGVMKAHISATPTTFIGLVLHKNSRRAMEQGLIFEGDPKALALLEQWLGDCQIDWAEIMASYLGDATAHSIETTLHRLLSKSRQSVNDLCAQIGEYAVEENLSPPRPLVNHFLEAVDVLRAGVERLEAKLA